MGINYRRQANQTVLDKKKKKKRKKRTREGKRSSASSASASGSPDSTGPRRAKAQMSQSCPNLMDKNAQSELPPELQDEVKINECLRWPAHSLYIENSFRTDLTKKFPVSGTTEDEENERIAIYKMNRRKRYLAAQQVSEIENIPPFPKSITSLWSYLSAHMLLQQNMSVPDRSQTLFGYDRPSCDHI